MGCSRGLPSIGKDLDVPTRYLCFIPEIVDSLSGVGLDEALGHLFTLLNFVEDWSGNFKDTSLVGSGFGCLGEESVLKLIWVLVVSGGDKILDFPAILLGFQEATVH